ncbi:DUF4145 domain-containing protein [Paraburkholderia nemoris]|uniref:DUF4145 domain-containing protein n=1 Tax=Paraburkholderia nemoris TaxID=2793076 RepID=UPI0038B8E556
MPQNAQTYPMQRCPHCYVDNPNLSRGMGPLTTRDSFQQSERQWTLFVCNRCGGCVMGAYKMDSGFWEAWPDANAFSPDIPAEPLDYLVQAAGSLNQPRASVMTSAGAVDSMLKAKGLVDGNLYARIKQAVEQHLLTPDMAEWAHDVRLDANDQRHADVAAVPPDFEDAKRCLEFAKALADILFVLPARVTRGKTSAHKAAVKAGVAPTSTSSISKAPPPIKPLR